MGTKDFGSPTKMRGKLLDESDNKNVNLDALSDAIQQSRSTVSPGDVSSEVETDLDEAVTQTSQVWQSLPDGDILNTKFDGQFYRDLPYVVIVCSANNTKMHALDGDHSQISYCSPRQLGFLHAKKRTNVAAEAAGIHLGQNLRNMNMRTIRVVVKGFNNGRIAAVKGLAMAGLRVVSVSDMTYVDWGTSKRPKKRKRRN